MNSCIENLDQVAFSVWDGMSITVVQSILLLTLISSLSYWLLEKERKALWIGLGCMTLFFVLRSVSFVETSLQKKLIVYNVPKHQAIDIMNGRRNYFIGDDALRQNEFLHNFHIKPSRLLHRIKENIPLKAHSLRVADKRILIIDTTILFKSMMPRVNIDLIILSRNPRVYINKILKSFKVEQIILDGSVPSWKARLWKKDCDSLKIPCHDVTEKGAFVINF
jgi:competence protein ComEC